MQFGRIEGEECALEMLGRLIGYIIGEVRRRLAGVEVELQEKRRKESIYVARSAHPLSRPLRRFYLYRRHPAPDGVETLAQIRDCGGAQRTLTNVAPG